MAYVDAYYDKKKDEINVVERVNGKRHFVTFPANHVFYVEDARGDFRDMWGRPVKKVSTPSIKEFRKELKKYSGRTVYESDINPVFRCLEENYLGLEPPVLNVGFFDIEVDFDPMKGFASPWDTFSRITAISIYLSSVEKLVTLVLKPELPVGHKYYMSWEKAEEIVNKFDNTVLCNDEEELLNYFLDLIEDCDVLSGWNSKGYDIPYLINRIEMILGKEATKRFCLWDQLPRKTKYVQFKTEKETYKLIGRVHLDYLDLYKKHNPQEMHSYKLDYIGEIEVGENKVPYEGTLDELYKKDFEKFIEYNRQDTMLLVKIDKKKRFIELSNQLAHTNTVLIDTTMGSVALIEQAIINETHSRGMCVPNRKPKPFNNGAGDDDDDYIVDVDDDYEEYEEEGDKPVVGAYVAVPKSGIHHEIGCCDINSLYPSTLRSLNMGPETLIGQIRSDRTNALIEQRIKDGIKGSDVWNGIFATLEYDIVKNKKDDVVVVDFIDGTTLQLTGEELYDYIFGEGNSLSISANGTLFRTDVEGVIPGLLSKWYSQRKQMQYRETVFSDISENTKGLALKVELADAIRNSSGKKSDFNELPEYIKANDADSVKFLIDSGLLKMEEDALFSTHKTTKKAKELKVFWNQRQQARKILLNSLYGALLNESCRFYDQRIGQSVTLTGRSIAKHMNSKVNEIITGVYQYDGDAIIYADTDSSYFSAYEMMKNDPELSQHLKSREMIIQLYDGIGEAVNESFPEFMNGAFNTGIERGGIIKAGRELVASRGLFITKKRYALLMYDKDGTRLDVNGKPGKIKAMGLDLKRADTPKLMQDFLEEILLVLLDGGTKETIFEMVGDFRDKFKALDPWLMGSPKKVNGITGYVEQLEKFNDFQRTKKLKDKKTLNIPGHVRASINWNNMKEANDDKYSMEIQDGQKVIVCKLKPNLLKMDSIAYPFDETHLPDWFKELPFDTEEMENIIIDKKINNLISVLGWDLNETRKDNTFSNLFSF